MGRGHRRPHASIQVQAAGKSAPAKVLTSPFKKCPNGLLPHSTHFGPPTTAILSHLNTQEGWHYVKER